MHSERAPRQDVLQRLRADRPALHAGGQSHWDVSVGTLDLLARLATDADRTLEVGCGVSTIVFAAAQSTHVAISPAPDEYDRISAYCESIGVSTGSVEFREGYSADVLPRLEGEFDLILIDGAHSFPYPIVDYHYASRLLRTGGVLVIDDVPIPSAGAVYRFLTGEPSWELMEVADNRAAAFRLREPLPAGDPWGEQGINRSYPDYSFLPPARRLRVEARTRVSHARAVSAARQRFPAINNLAPLLRRLLS